ncbi:MAG: ABC transporter permease [Clostridia bacterium]|nr:ABC transporter permease [Clostridia bacterium]
MIGFTIRNLKVFFKDKASVFFSLLAVFIIIALYALFLGDVWVSDFEEIPNARYLMDSWIIAGLLAVTSVTTTMGAFGSMLDDKRRKIIKDFVASPISNTSITAGYIVSSIIIGIIMSIVTLILGELYILANGGTLLSAGALVKTLLLIVLATVSNSTIILFLVSLFASPHAFATASTIIGTLIGFLTGIYLPIGTLPNAVQWIVKCFPPSHAAVLFRQVMMADAMETAFSGVPAAYVNEIHELLGIKFNYGGSTLSPMGSIAILIGSAILFFGLSVLAMSRKKR